MDFKKTARIGAATLCILYIPSVCLAKSVFAIASHSTSATNAYLVKNDGTIDFQTTVDSAEYFSIRATGLCVWPSIDRMFATYEDGGLISWGSTKTLTRDTDDEITTPESSLAGIVADEAKGVLYVVTRSGGRLYTYTFDIENDTLVLVHPDDPAYPNRAYRQLEGLESSTTFGLALDDDGGPLVFGFSTGLLYIADRTSTVRYYNTLTWELEGTVDMGRSAVGIDVDGDGHLYAGGYFGNPAHNYLVRYDLNDSDPNTALTEKDIGYNITDIIVDRDTGILYTTTRQVIDGRTGAVEVYDPAYWDSANPNDFYLDMDSRPNFDGPAGIGIGSQYKPPHDMYLAKVDDVEDPDGYVVPEDVYHYDITFHSGPMDEPNVVIIDCLPEEVDFVSADPNWGEYFPRPDHTYVLEIGDVAGYDPNVPGDPNYYFELTVVVNGQAEPGGTLYNKVTAESNWSYVDTYESTRVGCWGGDVIYVDRDGQGPCIGTTWETAYLYLDDALARADGGCGSEIWVAEGMYRPGDATGDSFVIPDGVEVYGGFASDETDPNERNWKRYKTILSGYIGEDDYGHAERNNTVITMGDNSLLDGVTVEEGNWQGIDGSDVTSTVTNCIIKENAQRGIYSIDGDVVIQWCEIKENGWQGIYHLGSGYSLTVENCKIHDNQYDGILTDSSTSQIKNSIIYMNGSAGDYYGVNIGIPYSNPTIHNNTIVHNTNEGIRFVGSNTPDVRNNILFYNNPQETNSPQIAGIGTTYYCCIYDPNSQSSTPDGNGNITCDPNFVYDSEPYGYYHIKYESYCRNAGDNNAVETGDVDMDDETRTQESIVDIGADEVACEDTWNPNDWKLSQNLNF